MDARGPTTWSINELQNKFETGMKKKTCKIIFYINRLFTKKKIYQ